MAGCWLSPALVQMGCMVLSCLVLSTRVPILRSVPHPLFVVLMWDLLPAWLPAGVPVKPMLAKICEGLPDALRQLKRAPFMGGWCCWWEAPALWRGAGCMHDERSMYLLGVTLWRRYSWGAAAEFKYDGVRAQIHLLPGRQAARVFSRSSEDQTAAYPDVVAQALAATQGECVPFGNLAGAQALSCTCITLQCVSSSAPLLQCVSSSAPLLSLSSRWR